MKLLPKSRQSEIIIQDLNKELLIYNLKTNQCFSLNETSKLIYQACNGKTSFNEIKAKYNYSDDLIFLALDELKKNDLLEDSYESKLSGVSRRDLIRNVGLTSMVALPMIFTLVAPNATQAASNCTTSLTQSFNTSGTCTSNCANCQCARDYCNANAIPCCSGPFSTTNFNGLRIFCNCN